MNDELDDLFHAAALLAYLTVARTQGTWPDSEAVRQEAYRLYEAELAEKERGEAAGRVARGVTRGSAGGRETFRRYGSQHMAEIGKRGFQSFTAKYFNGNREEASAWLRQRAYESRADTFAQRELERRLENGQEVASVELPVYSTDDEGIPF